MWKRVKPGSDELIETGMAELHVHVVTRKEIAWWRPVARGKEAMLENADQVGVLRQPTDVLSLLVDDCFFLPPNLPSEELDHLKFG